MSGSDLEQDLAGRRFGDFSLLRRLGRGAMAEVYLAEQLSLKRWIAFKALRGSLSGDETYVRRFHREAQAAASLIHAHIVQIYEVGCIDGVHFIAQEYVAGQNLQQAITRHGSPSPAAALSIMRQAASALNKAAEQGIIHRDIKPENIMLTEHGEVKVADFGLARLRDEDASSHLTQVGFTMGTPLYMSPEQVEDRPLDSRSDIYSLGVTFYEMLSGRPPFRGETALSVAVQHLQTPPPPLESLRPDLPPAFCRIVNRMLAKKPDDRYESPRSLQKELRSLGDLLAADDELAPIEHWTRRPAGGSGRLGTGSPGEPGSRNFDPLAGSAASLDSAPPSGARFGDLALDGSDPTSATVAAPSRYALTSQLTTLMQEPPPRLITRRGIVRAVLSVFLALGLGLLYARATQPRPLIQAPASGASHVPRHSSAEAQYLYAVFVNSEEGWRSVVEYFPNAYFAQRAEQQLARLYLEKEDWPRALPLFEKFGDLDDADSPEVKAFGLAGAAIVYMQEGETESAASELAELLPLRKHLDPQMQGQIKQLINRATRAHNDNTLQEWDQWLNKGKGSGAGKPSGTAKSPPVAPD